MSRPGTSAKKNRKILVDPEIRLVQTLRTGIEWANELDKHIKKTPVGDWDNKKGVIAGLVWAAALASETELDEDSWLDLACIAFRGVVRE